MRLWTSILAGLQILSGGTILMDFMEPRWVGLLVLVVAALQGGTIVYTKADGVPDHVYHPEHAVEGR